MRRQRRQLQIYVLCVLFALTLTIVSVSSPKSNQHKSQVVAEAISPIIQLFRKPIDAVKAFNGFVGDYLYAVDENQQLKDELAALKHSHDEASYLKDENKKLRELLSMSHRLEYDPLGVRIIADLESPYARSLLINAGKDKDIQAGQAALGSNGFIGRVIEVSDTTARVLLLIDYNARTPVRIAGKGHLGILRGGNDLSLELTLTPNPVELVEGDKFVTSGLEGLFKPGIPVAEVVKTSKGLDIRPFENLNQLDFITIHRHDTGDAIVPNTSEPTLVKP